MEGFNYCVINYVHWVHTSLTLLFLHPLTWYKKLQPTNKNNYKKKWLKTESEGAHATDSGKLFHSEITSVELDSTKGWVNKKDLSWSPWQKIWAENNAGYEGFCIDDRGLIELMFCAGVEDWQLIIFRIPGFQSNSKGKLLYICT